MKNYKLTSFCQHRSQSHERWNIFSHFFYEYTNSPPKDFFYCYQYYFSVDQFAYFIVSTRFFSTCLIFRSLFNFHLFIISGASLLIFPLPLLIICSHSIDRNFHAKKLGIFFIHKFSQIYMHLAFFLTQSKYL